MKRLGLLLLVAACSSGGGNDSNGPGGAALPLEANSLEFGQADLGSLVRQTLEVRNPIGGLPVTVTEVISSSTDLDLADPGFPRTIRPGDRLSIEVSWTPTDEGFFSETVRVEATDRTPLTVAISGTGFTSEQVVSFGLVAFESSSKKTPELFLDVPADAISFTIEAFGGTRAAPTGGPIFLDKLSGPGGRVYIDPAQPHGGPYRVERNFPAISINFGSLPFVPRDHASFQLPNSDDAGVELVPGGGTYSFVLSNEGGTLSGLNVQAVVERRLPGDASAGHIDINVFLANGLAATAAGARSDPHLQSLLARAHNVLGAAGVGFGDVAYYQLTDPQFDFGNPFNPAALFRQSSMASEARLNVFLVKTSSNGVAGLTGAIPSPRANGSPIAGLFVIGDENFHPDDLGTVLAHEIGHALGLGHTSEAPGAPLPWTVDIINDTCPGIICVGNPALYLMDSATIPPGTPQITPGQSHVALRHLFVAPGRATFTPGAVFGASPLLAAARLGGVACASCKTR